MGTANSAAAAATTANRVGAARRMRIAVVLMSVPPVGSPPPMSARTGSPMKPPSPFGGKFDPTGDNNPPSWTKDAWWAAFLQVTRRTVTSRMDRLTALEAVQAIADPDSFVGWDDENCVRYPVFHRCIEAIWIARRTILVLTSPSLVGQLRVQGVPAAMLAWEFGFLGGSVGVRAAAVVVAAIRRATAQGLPLIVVPRSGGTRMQEGAPAFVQMVAIAAAVAEHRAAGLPYLVHLCEPHHGRGAGHAGFRGRRHHGGAGRDGRLPRPACLRRHHRPAVPRGDPGGREPGRARDRRRGTDLDRAASIPGRQCCASGRIGPGRGGLPGPGRPAATAVPPMWQVRPSLPTSCGTTCGSSRQRERLDAAQFVAEHVTRLRHAARAPARLSAAQGALVGVGRMARGCRWCWRPPPTAVRASR